MSPQVVIHFFIIFKMSVRPDPNITVMREKYDAITRRFLKWPSKMDTEVWRILEQEAKSPLGFTDLGNDSAKVDLFVECIVTAAEAHAETGKTRKDGKTPYFFHPLRVARNVRDCVPDVQTEVVMAALLHDTVEDTKLTLDDIKAKFGCVVASYVSELTDDKSIADAHSRKRRQWQKASSMSLGAAIVKCLDKADNCLSTIENLPVGWSKEKKETYFDESAHIVKALGVEQRAPGAFIHFCNVLETTSQPYKVRVLMQGVF